MKSKTHPKKFMKPLLEKLRFNRNISKSRLILFIIGFALIGVITLLSSYAAGSSTISGELFDDANRNGIRDAGEAPFTGVAVKLYRDGGPFVTGVALDANGRYSFSGLEDGNYIVEMDYTDWINYRKDWVTTTTQTLYPRVTVNLVGTATANIGLRKIIRSTTLGSPLSSTTLSNGTKIESYNDAVTATTIGAELQTGTLFGGEAPLTIIRFDYNTGSSCATSVSGMPGTYKDFSASIWVDYLSWLTDGSRVLSHEYGHAWSLYYAQIVQQDDTFTSYLKARGLYGDSRLGSDKYWDPKELIAEDYRQLFGSTNSRSFGQDNNQIPNAKDVPGLEDFLRNTFTKSPADTTKPSAPGNLSGTAVSSTQIDLTWTAATDNIGVTNYDVYRNNVLIGSISGTSTSYVDAGDVNPLVANTSYSYYVIARDSANNSSAASNTISVTTPSPDTTKPSAPANLKVTSQATTSIGLSWTGSTDNVGVKGYRIYQSSKTSYSQLVATVTGTSHTVTGLKAGSGYSYSVVAIDAAGNESVPSNTVNTRTKR